MYRQLLGLQERVEQEEAAASNYQVWETLYEERQVVVTRMHKEFLTVCREDEARYQTYRDAWTAYESYRKTREVRHARYKQLESLWERNEAWTRQQRVRDLEARLDELERDKAIKRNEHRDILRYRVEQDAQEKQLHHILQQLEVIQEKRIALEVEKRSMEVKKEERAARNASLEKDQRDLSTLLQRRDLLEFLVKKVFHRDGFPLFMLRKLIGEFESRLETILEPFFPSRKLRLQIDETGTSIHMRIENTGDGTTMPNLFLGGMEGLMVDVGMKVVWNMISTEPRCNLFILDENISVLDQGHLQNLRHIFEFLEQHFDHILVISHLDIVKDFVHGCIRTTVDPETNKRSLTLVT
jgi:IS1 family transposase